MSRFSNQNRIFQTNPEFLRKINPGFDGKDHTFLQDVVTRRPVLRITLKTKGDFQKVYIDKVLDAKDDFDEGSATPPTPQEVKEDPAETPPTATRKVKKKA